MKKFFPLAVLFLAVAGVAWTLLPPRQRGAFDLAAFGRLPVLVNGRVKPLDTVARTTLLTTQGRQRVKTPNGTALTPEAWLLDVLYKPSLADAYQTFEIVHPDLLALFNLRANDGAGGKRFSAHQLHGGLAELDRQARLADDVENAQRNAFQRAAIQLRNNVALYQRLQASLQPPAVENFFTQLADLEKELPARAAGAPADGGMARGVGSGPQAFELAQTFLTMETLGYLRLIPGEEKPADPATWKTMGGALQDSLTRGRFHPSVAAYVALGRAWLANDPAAFNAAVHAERARLERVMPAWLAKCDVEARFNAAEPFYTSAMLYVLAFLAAVFSWLRWPDALGRAGFWLMAVAFVVASAGIATRMWLEGRPPVTNLYSSALFVGWGAVLLCLFIEWFFRNGLATVAGGLVGFGTLVIAHHLALGGDTMEMMRAVLDSNFWLTTHVVAITVGYSATFLAGFLGLVYVLRGVFTRSLDKATAEALARMIYGVVCFATLFSLLGTVLGGIWADQSWGRFWGWDPKENGALIIVIWNAVILHAHWGGLIEQRGLANLAIFGNVVTAWSWFGVNMLGVGLHSYGFMDAAFWWLVAFVISQVAVIAIASLPTDKWRSFRAG